MPYLGHYTLVDLVASPLYSHSTPPIANLGVTPLGLWDQNDLPQPSHCFRDSSVLAFAPQSTPDTTTCSLYFVGPSSISWWCTILFNDILSNTIRQLGCGLTINNRCPLKAGSRQPGLAQRMRNLMPKSAETVSRRPKIVIVWHNQCQDEPMSSPC